MTEELIIKSKYKRVKPRNTWYLEIKSNLTYTTDLFSLLSQEFQNSGLPLEIREISPREIGQTKAKESKKIE